DQGSHRQVQKRVQEIARLAFLTQPDEELGPGAVLKDVRQAYDQKADNSEFLNREFHIDESFTSPPKLAGETKKMRGTRWHLVPRLSKKMRGTRWHLVPRLSKKMRGTRWHLVPRLSMKMHGTRWHLVPRLSKKMRGTRWHLVPRLSKK